MVGASLLVQLFAVQLNRELASPLGPVPVADVVSVLLAMTAGGAVACSRAFRWVAIALQILVWAAIIATLYLAPKDYHRFHVPLDGEITGATYVPGELWPVNLFAVTHVADLAPSRSRFRPVLPVDLASLQSLTVYGGPLAPESVGLIVDP